MRLRTLLLAATIGLVLAAALTLWILFRRDVFRGVPLDGPPVALVGARIYDPAGDSVSEATSVVISGREIVAVGRSTPIPDGARIINLTGLTLLPGFIDSHVHISGIRSRADGTRELGWLRYLWRFTRKFPERRRTILEAGITTTKSLGDPYPWIAHFAERIERHRLAGPRIFFAGPMFTAPGGHPVARFRQAGQGDTSFIAQVTRQLASPHDAGPAVNQISRDVDFLSVVLENRGFADLPTLSAPVLQEIAAAAHRHELPMLVHVNRVRDIDLALASAASGIEHVPFDAPLDSAWLQALASRRIFVDPTLQAVEQYVGELLHDTAAARLARTNTRRLYEAGVRLVVGSDAPSPGTTFGPTFHEELRNLVEIGLSPGAAIAAATVVAAEYLGLSDQLGTIEPGKWADILAVRGEPWLDISAASRIYLVIADGQVVIDRLDQYQRPGGVIAHTKPPARDTLDRAGAEGSP
jgi:imidazolonepropionase-like amidohydrolase